MRDENTNASHNIDIGDCDNVCEFCDAFFWFDECAIATSTRHRLKYTQCCRGGRVALPYPRRPYTSIIHLFQQDDFMSKIRAYNSVFSMTSFGAKIDDTVNQGSGPYIFKISGQVHHWLGTLCPPPNQRPLFLQMYVYDTDNEIANRLHPFSLGNESSLCPQTVSLLLNILESTNEVVKLFRTARDLCLSADVPEFSVCLYGSREKVSYDMPSPGCIGAIVTDVDPLCTRFDIVVRHREGGPQRISKLHPLYMPLQYPLLFLYGERGWSPELSLRVNDGARDRKLTMNMYYSYLLHDRRNLYTLLLRGGRLLQQFIVDAYVCIEESRLDYIRLNQSVFRNDFLQGVCDAVQRGDTEGREIGKRTVLPSSFVGGPRYMHKHYQDALAICRVHDVYTVEFQKRGLPHCHILLWVNPSCIIRDVSEIDNFISAEIPDPSIDPHLYNIVTELMIHGPCGLLIPNSPCMVSGSCSKSFPKHYEPETSFDDNGCVHYRRRSNGFFVRKGNVNIDNRYVAPYNRTLSLHFMAHINVEYCGWSMLIKYLFKYISKGVDHIHYSISKSSASVNVAHRAQSLSINEIQNFVDGRFICPHEAAWRIFNFDIHDRNPYVQVLAVHLENMQNVTFRDTDQLQNVVDNPFYRKTTLTEWLSNNNRDSSGRHLRYIDYLSEYKWDTSSKIWLRRASDKPPAIGRLIYIHPSCGETFFLRMLLGYQRGCTSFVSIRTVNGEVCLTFRAACEKLGLLGDDVEWSTAFEEASTWAIAAELRALFTQILLFCDITDPLKMWNEQWHRMADDGQRNYDIVNDEDLKQYVLYKLELLLHFGSPSKSLTDCGLPLPRADLLQQLQNSLLMEERNYDRHMLSVEHQDARSKLNCQQKRIYEDVISGIASATQVLVFVYGHGGTCKTFLWTTIISALRSNGSIVLAVAAYGIASLLLPSGRTAHSRFKIPLEVTENSLCHIKKNTQLAQLLTQTSLIIWDEAPMNDRRCFETLDRSLRDLFDCQAKPFGGKSVLLVGDFRQTLPIIQGASKSTILASSLPRSYLWNNFKVYKLTENMRLQRPNITSAEQNLISAFSSWLVSIGDGDIGTPDMSDPQDAKLIRIPDQYLIPYTDNALPELIHFIYDNDTFQNPNATTLSRKAIIFPTNNIVHEINSMVLDMAAGPTKTYTSIDSVVPHPGDNTDIDVLYPVEYLNLLNFNGLPTHVLELKVNSPVVLLRNLNPKDGLCNGTRLIVTQLLPAIVEVQIMTGKFIGRKGDAIEVIADLDQQQHFDEILRVQACYTVTNYVTILARTINKVVDHKASLRIGLKASIIPLTDVDIPCYYFKFATHDLLKTHREYPRPLVDYMGRLERKFFQNTSKNERLRKFLIQDEWKKEVEITFWHDMEHAKVT
ncbi:uncharacterized protein LOC143602118 [Bidens hawaiensis]|uniref:uncharacterized protein LOC143602118 n=1 Tax=Bidens hawaiensis TaxID=980011 RepID=UPI00404AB294